MLFHDSQRSDELANVCLSVLDRLKPTGAVWKRIDRLN